METCRDKVHAIAIACYGEGLITCPEYYKMMCGTPPCYKCPELCSEAHISYAEEVFYEESL